MRRISHHAPMVVAALLLACAAGRGQVVPDGLYCNTGLHPDGYIDMSDLPPAPTGTATGPVSNVITPPVTATLPVHGVPGLTVTISIPALFVGSAGVPAYTVDGVRLQLNGPNSDPSAATVITLGFSNTIRGIGLDVGNPAGRFLYTYNLQAGEAPLPGPVAAFSNTAAGYTFFIDTPRSENLQAVALDTPFQVAALQFEGDFLEGFSNPIFSNIRVQSFSAPDPADSITKDGLQLWLRSDKGVATSPASAWQDQSGNGHDATPTPGHAPTFTADGRTCQGAWLFNGSSSFDFNLPIAGWREMTVFLVARSTKDPPPDTYNSFSSAILWTENAYWGNTFVSPYQTHLYARFGTTRINTNLSFLRPGAGIAGDFTITRAVHDRETDSLYVNGIRVLSQQGNLPALGGVTGAGTIGAGFNGTYYDGEISEILVYSRVLSVQESVQVESYLRNKYGTQ